MRIEIRDLNEDGTERGIWRVGDTIRYDITVTDERDYYSGPMLPHDLYLECDRTVLSIKDKPREVWLLPGESATVTVLAKVLRVPPYNLTLLRAHVSVPVLSASATESTTIEGGGRDED